MIRVTICNFTGLFVMTLLMACSQSAQVNSSDSAKDLSGSGVVHMLGKSHPYVAGVVKAINIGGPQYIGTDGILYESDSLDLKSSRHRSSAIQGSQDPTLFESYRLGDMDLEFEVANGRYDVTFMFAEPKDIAVGQRLFDVTAQGETVIADLDVRLARDGRTLSALVRTAFDIDVKNALLQIGFESKKGQPLLHGIVIRKAQQDTRDWQLVWQDEFDYQGKPDPAKWQFDIWPARKVNDEDQAYTDRLKNARVENGKLIIQAHKETYGNADYTSARLHNMHKGDLLYGRIDVMAKLPAGQGTWAAIWMLPSDPFRYATTCGKGADWQGSSTCDAWPNSGEIDIMEHVGYDMQTVHGTVHNKAYYWVNFEQRKASIEGQSVDQQFHLYSLQWSPQQIIISMDNRPYFYYLNEQQGWQSWPFDHPYHLIMNLAIGGAWGRAGGPIDESIFPVQMEVDYVRIYQLP